MAAFHFGGLGHSEASQRPLCAAKGVLAFDLIFEAQFELVTAVVHLQLAQKMRIVIEPPSDSKALYRNNMAKRNTWGLSKRLRS